MKIDGKTFEAGTIASLRTDFDCDVQTTDRLDRDHKIDGEIRRIGRAVLKMPVQLQMTLRVRHLAKLREYLSTRWLNRDIASLYVEVKDGVTMRETAEHLAWAAQEVQRLPWYGRMPFFGLAIDDDAAFFDPYARLRELEKEWRSPERLAALQHGMAGDFGPEGFRIIDDGGYAYRAHYIDAFNPRFRGTLRNAGDKRIPVRFLPVGPQRASDVRSHR